MQRRAWGPLALIAALGCGSSAESPAPTTSVAPPTTAATAPAPPAAHAEEPTIAAPASCVRAAECCHGYLAALGIADADTQTRACAPLAANVFDPLLEGNRCTDQLDLWRGELEALRHPPLTECASLPAPPSPPDPAPAPPKRVAGVEVDPYAGSFVVRSTDVAAIERVLSRGLAPFSFEGGVRADASLAHGPTLTLAAGGPFTRALAYAAPRVTDTDPETVESLFLIVLVGATESRVLVISAVDYTEDHAGPLAMEAAADGRSLGPTWTAEHTGGYRDFETAGDPTIRCSASYPAERSVTRWEARCDLTGDPHCTYGATTEQITPDPSPRIECHDADGHVIATPTGTSAPTFSHEPRALELVEDPHRGVALRDHEGADLSAQLRRSEGTIDWLCDDEFRAANARRDPELVRVEAENQRVGWPDLVIERRELPDFASMNGDEGSGSWFLFFARDHGTWTTVETTFVSTLAYGEPDEDGEDSPGRSAGVPLALDLVPGGATELVVPVRCDLGESRRCDGIVVCGARDATTQCRALPLRVTEGTRRVSSYDAVRFDLAGHLVLTPHGGTEETHELAAWLAEPAPETEQ